MKLLINIKRPFRFHRMNMRDPPSKLPYAIWRKKAVPIERGTACSGDPNRAALGVVVEREHELYDGRR